MNLVERERRFMANESDETRTFNRQNELDEVARTASKDATETVESLKASGWVPEWQAERN